MVQFEIISDYYGEHIKDKTFKGTRAKNFENFFEFMTTFKLAEGDICRMTDLETNEIIFELKI